MVKKLETLFRKEIREQQAYTLKHYDKVIKLDQNELPWNLPPSLKAKWIKRLQQAQLNRYPEVQPEKLRQALAKKFGVKAEQVLVGNGSNVLIQALTVATAVGQKVMAPDPSFALYKMNAKGLGNRFIPIKLSSQDFSWDLPAVLKQIRQHQPKLIFIPNPNAPTGNLFSLRDIEQIIKVSQGLVVVDEAYRQFSQVSLVKKIAKYPRLACLHTFSKGYGLGGARVGYLLAHAEVIAQVSKVVAPYGVTQISEAAALLALQHEKVIAKEIKQITVERDRVFAAMQKISKLKVFPSAGNFLLFRVKDSKKCFQHLLKQGVLVRDQSSHPKLKGCLRVTIGTPRENAAFLRAISSYSS